MHDTVTKLLDYAEGYARAYRGSTYERHAARQALQDELRRLLTPLTDEQIEEITVECRKQFRDYAMGRSSEKPKSLARVVGAKHGITGGKADPCPGCQTGVVCKSLSCGRLKLAAVLTPAEVELAQTRASAGEETVRQKVGLT